MLWCMIFLVREGDVIEVRFNRFFFFFRNMNELGCFDVGRNFFDIGNRVLNGWVVFLVFF